MSGRRRRAWCCRFTSFIEVSWSASRGCPRSACQCARLRWPIDTASWTETEGLGEEVVALGLLRTRRTTVPQIGTGAPYRICRERRSR